MKRRIVFILSFVCILAALSGSTGTSDVIATEKFADMTEEELTQELAGVEREKGENHRPVGEPHGSLSGLHGEIYDPGENGRYIVLYYNAYQTVETVKVNAKVQ